MTLHPESTFTKPRDDCPSPDRWHAIDGYATEVEVTWFIAAMVRALQPDLVVETGTHRGSTARAIGRALLKNGRGELVTVELDRTLAAAARKVVEDLPVTVEMANSLDVRMLKPIDLLWLDSAMYSNDKLHRIEEYRHFRSQLSSRAVVMVHDTGPHKPLRDALDELDDIAWIHLPTPRGVSIGRLR